MREQELFGSRVSFLPGQRPVVFNVALMPSCVIKVYRRGFRVTPELWHSGDYSEIIRELVGMRLIAPRDDYEVRRVVIMHDFFDVMFPDAEGVMTPALRLYAASSVESFEDEQVRERSEATGG